MTVMSESVIPNTDTKKSLIWVPLQKSFKTDTWAACFSEAEDVSLYLYQSKTEEKEWWTRGILFTRTQSQTLPRTVHLCFHVGVNVHTEINLQTCINLLFRDHQQAGPLSLQTPVTFEVIENNT